MYGRLFVLFAFAVTCLGTLATPAAAYSVRRCDPIAEGDVSLAADYVNRRLQRLADQFTHLSEANRDEFVRKWPRVDIVCQDEGLKNRSRECLAVSGGSCVTAAMACSRHSAASR
jgi:hypothetical protein